MTGDKEACIVWFSVYVMRREGNCITLASLRVLSVRGFFCGFRVSDFKVHYSARTLAGCRLALTLLLCVREVV